MQYNIESGTFLLAFAPKHNETSVSTSHHIKCILTTTIICLAEEPARGEKCKWPRQDKGAADGHEVFIGR